MNTISHYRPSKGPKVSQVTDWTTVFSDSAQTWKGQDVWAWVEQGRPFPDFYRVMYTIDGVKKSKLFYGETAWNDAERFVYDLGLFDVAGSMVFQNTNIINSQKLNLDATGLSKGIYFIKIIHTDNFVSIEKLVVE